MLKAKRSFTEEWKPEHEPMPPAMPFRHIGGDPFGGDNDHDRWFVFITKPNAEKAAGESIRDLGYQVFVPLEKRIQRVPKRRPREYEAALFPRYGFVRFNDRDARWVGILGADGVVEIMRTVKGQPIPVPDKQMDRLFLAEKMGLFDRTQPMKVGMDVEVVDGPFSSFIGKIVKARAKDRVRVLLSIFDSMIEVDMPLVSLREA